MRYHTSLKHDKKIAGPNNMFNGRTAGEIVIGTQIYATGERVTKARLNVLTALSNIKKPTSIKNLSALVPGHDKATLYRTLETLSRVGLVKKILVSSSESLYETNINRHHHHHITCTRCGFIEDTNICVNTPSPKDLRLMGFETITDHCLEFFGICKKCAKN